MQGNEQHLAEFAERMSHIDEEEKEIVLSMFSNQELLAKVMKNDSMKDNIINSTARLVNGGY